jgi:hypothetical protein
MKISAASAAQCQLSVCERNGNASMAQWRKWRWRNVKTMACQRHVQCNRINENKPSALMSIISGRNENGVAMAACSLIGS